MNEFNHQMMTASTTDAFSKKSDRGTKVHAQSPLPILGRRGLGIRAAQESAPAFWSDTVY